MMALSVRPTRAKRSFIVSCGTLSTLCCIAGSALAEAQVTASQPPHLREPASAKSTPPPAGVAGAAMPGAGKSVSFYYRQWTRLDGLIAGARKVNPEWVVLNGKNINQPPEQYRRMPVEATVDMQAFGVAYGLSQRFSIYLSGTYFKIDGTTLTFAGDAGTTRLGTTDFAYEGFGDSLAGVNAKIWSGQGQQVIAGLSVSFPTGSITKHVELLLPNGQLSDSKVGYAGQLGTGTFNLVPTLAYTGSNGAFGYGVAYRGRFALEDENSEGYRRGSLNVATAWLSWAATQDLSGSLRIEGTSEGAFHGRDMELSGPGLGSNPANVGGERVNVFAGLDLHGAVANLGNGRLAMEFGLPVYENANGIHLAHDWTLQMLIALRF